MEKHQQKSKRTRNAKAKVVKQELETVYGVDFDTIQGALTYCFGTENTSADVLTAKQRIERIGDMEFNRAIRRYKRLEKNKQYSDIAWTNTYHW